MDTSAKYHRPCCKWFYAQRAKFMGKTSALRDLGALDDPRKVGMYFNLLVQYGESPQFLSALFDGQPCPCESTLNPDEFGKLFGEILEMKTVKIAATSLPLQDSLMIIPK